MVPFSQKMLPDSSLNVPNSVAHIPVPVAISRTWRITPLRGARWSFPFNVAKYKLCCMSIHISHLFFYHAHIYSPCLFCSSYTGTFSVRFFSVLKLRLTSSLGNRYSVNKVNKELSRPSNICGLGYLLPSLYLL